MKILCINFNSTIQRTLLFDDFNTGEVNRSKQYFEHASGKGINTARVLNQISPSCAEVLCTTGITESNYFKKLLKKDNIKPYFIRIPTKIRHCWTILSKEKTSEIICEESSPLVLEKANVKYEKKFLSKFNKLIKKFDGILLAGSCPLFFTSEIYKDICVIAKENKKIILADYFGEKLLYTLKHTAPTIIKINEEEFTKTFLQNKLNEIDLDNYIKKQMNLLSCKYKSIFIVTRGEKSVYIANNGIFHEIKTPLLTPVNTTACGDSFNAGFIYEFLNSKDYLKSTNKGIWCATKNAQSFTPGSINSE
ncbi:MAG: hypothetical protein J6B63_04050 [Treponema sp.]|nr:hypothetical protein [Treponema sp.]